MSCSTFPGEREAKRVLTARDTLAEAGFYSVPAHIGRVALITQYVHDGHPCVETEQKLLRQERLALIDYFSATGKHVVDTENATWNDVTALIQEPNISDMCVIAHGSLGSFSLLPSQERQGTRHYAARHVAQQANHLKTGAFYVRTCSGIGGTAVPWALAVASYPEKIHVSRTALLEPTVPAQTPDEYLAPLFKPQTGPLTFDMLRHAVDEHYRRIHPSSTMEYS